MPTSHLTSPLLTVAVPAYNGAEFLASALESVLAQATDDVEIIVVDDGSTDGTGDVVRQFGSRVRYISQRNSGLAAARNRGHMEARGEFVAWFDCDDICEPARFALQLEVLQRYPEIGLVSTGFSAFDDKGTIAESFADRYYGKIGRSGVGPLFEASQPFESATMQGMSFPLHRGSVYRRLALGNFIHPPTVMMRSEVWHKTGPLVTGLASATDWEFLVRASRLYPFAYLDRPLLRYRRSRQQMTDDSNTLTNLPREMRAFELILKADPLLRESSEQIRGLYRYWYVSLATVAVSSDRLLAFRYLAASLRHGCDVGSFLRAAIRMLTPAFLLPVFRWARRAVVPLRNESS